MFGRRRLRRASDPIRQATFFRPKTWSNSRIASTSGRRSSPNTGSCHKGRERTSFCVYDRAAGGKIVGIHDGARDNRTGAGHCFIKPSCLLRMFSVVLPPADTKNMIECRLSGFDAIECLLPCRVVASYGKRPQGTSPRRAVPSGIKLKRCWSSSAKIPTLLIALSKR